jgi:hypothetical protein
MLLACALAVLLLAGGSVVAGAADNSNAVRTPINVNALSCTDHEPLWLLAQSVPSASQVPCVRSLPAGWTLNNVSVNSGLSVVTLDHDRAGTGALVAELTAACDPRGADEIGSDQAGVRRYQRADPSVHSTVRFDVFPGGCLTTKLVAPPEHNAQLTADMSEIVGFTTRQTLQQVLEQRSRGRLHLDPAY